MKHYIKNVSWRFNDCSSMYPELNNKRIKIQSPEDVFNNFSFFFRGQVKEYFIVIWLNSANIVSGFEVVSHGILNESVVHPREVYRGAIVSTCASIILAHNHPSGNLNPSSEDMTITKKIVEAGKIIDIRVNDHIIFTDDSYFSFIEQNLL